MNSLDLAIALSYLTHINPANSLKQETRIEFKLFSEIWHTNYGSMHLLENGELRSEIYVCIFMYLLVRKCK